MLLFLVKTPVVSQQSIRWCVIMMHQPVHFLPMFRAMSLQTFMQLPQNVVESEIDLPITYLLPVLPTGENYLYATPLTSKKIMNMFFTLLLTCHTFLSW